MCELDKLERYLSKHGYEYKRIDDKLSKDLINLLVEKGVYAEGQGERHQLIVFKDGCEWFDAICNAGSYGFEDGLLEIMGGEDITKHPDGVEGWLTAQDVIEKIENWKCPDITMSKYQAWAMRTSRKDISPDDHLFNGILGLSGEVGECADLVKKCFYQDGRAITEKLKEELGDVLWYIAEVASAMGWSLADVAVKNIEKLKKRYPDGFSADKSIDREV